MPKDKTFFNAVYDVLVEFGGAPKHMRGNFVQCHLDENYPCKEYRFMGLFGFGGKYRSETNSIDYYRENTTIERDAAQKIVNDKLKSIYQDGTEMQAQTKPQPLKEWVDQQREIMLGKMGMNMANEKHRAYYEGQADAYMSVLMHMAVYKDSD